MVSILIYYLKSHFIHLTGAAKPVEPGACDFGGSLQFMTAPYLFPCIIEYSLIMAAIGYKLYFNVHKVPHEEHHVLVEQSKKTLKSVLPYVLFGVLGTFTATFTATSIN